MTDSKIYVVQLHKCTTRSTEMLLFEPPRLFRTLAHRFPDRRLSRRLGEEGVAVRRQWVRLRPDKQEAHHLLAKSLLGTGNLAPEASARDAIAAEQDQPEPYALLSGILMRTGPVTEARAMARRTVEYGLYHRRFFCQAPAGILRNGELCAACRL